MMIGSSDAVLTTVFLRSWPKRSWYWLWTVLRISKLRC